MKRRHPVFDDHPIAGMLISMVLVGIFGLIISAVVRGIFGINSGNENELGNQLIECAAIIFGAAVCLLFHRFWFRGEIKGFFRLNGLGRGLMLGWSIFAVCLIIIICNYVISDNQIGNIPAALILGAAPGIREETLVRLIPLSIAMRQPCKKRMLPIACCLTSVLFGVLHLINLLAGADFVSTLLQVLYATGIGLTFAGIYLCTGNIWITMLLHTLMDSVSYLNVGMQESGGVLTGSNTASELAVLIVFTVLFYINAVTVLRKKRRDEAAAVWVDMWPKQPADTYID